MNEQLVQQYIEESQAYMEKQAAEIAVLQNKLEKAEADRKMDKHASEDNLYKLANCLKEGQYKTGSVINAIRKMDIGLLEKEAELEDVDDSWGELDGDTGNTDNLRPSEVQLYTRLGLI